MPLGNCRNNNYGCDMLELIDERQPVLTSRMMDGRNEYRAGEWKEGAREREGMKDVFMDV